jgi:hypothetical protein
MEKRTSKGWLKAIIIPVHTKGNIKHENYRGGCKINTNIIKNKLYTYYKNKLDEQNRFIIYIYNKNKCFK